MAKMISVVVALTLLFAVPAMGGELKVGDKASDWQFEDAQKKMFTLESWAGKVLLVNYTDPDEADLNEHFTEAVKKAKDDGQLKSETYKGIGIADLKASWKPDFLIRKIAAGKAKKYNTVILFDYDASLREAWGLANNTANAIILDKNRICRAIIRGRVPDDQVASLVQLLIDLQNK